MNRIDMIYTKYPFYGVRRIDHTLRRERHVVNHKRISRLMHIMGIEGIRPKKNLSLKDSSHKAYPYLLKDLDIVRSNQVWGVDITYIRLLNGWAYMVAILDWYSRYVLSWELSDSLHIGFCLDALGRALDRGKPEIHNSDQGSHFTSGQCTSLLQQAEVQISMDSKGRALDNIFVERLWRTVKYKEVYLKEYGNLNEARRNLITYMDFYNNERLHQSLNYKTPAEIYLS